MNDKTFHLWWGVGLFMLYVVLFSVQVPIMRLCDALKPSQTLALMFLSEAASLLPLVTIIRQEWAVSKPKEWVAYSTLGLLLGSFYVTTTYCAQHMNLGTFAFFSTFNVCAKM